MNPDSKGWLKDYLQFRQGLFQDLTTEGHKSRHPDFSLYRVLQPTGLMYGQPVSTFDHPDSANWNTKDRLKILLAESLISSSLLFHDRPVKDPEEMSAVLMKTVDNINSFYIHVFPEMATSSKTIFGRKKSALEIAEQILNRRIDQVDSKANFWIRFFHNSLLFLDIFIFGQWIHTNADKIVSDFFNYEREELRTSLVKVIAAAAHANHMLEFEERKLLDYFLQSAHLSPERKKECKDIFEHGISIDELSLPTNNSWILRKYFLEMAILTLWADKRMEESELVFMRRFAETLSFSPDDMDNSMLAVEGFILEHWKELDYLQEKQTFEEVTQQFVDRMAVMAAKHKGKLMQEVRAGTALVAMLTKARSSELNAQEKQELQKLLVSVLRCLPTFAIVSLPQRFLTLPILMQILPKNFIADSLEA